MDLRISCHYAQHVNVAGLKIGLQLLRQSKLDIEVKVFVRTRAETRDEQLLGPVGPSVGIPLPSKQQPIWQRDSYVRTSME